VRQTLTFWAVVTVLCAMFALGQESPAPSYRFSSDSATVNIPFKEVANGLIFVRAQVNGHPGWFILDNAAQGFTVDRSFAHQIALVSGEHALARTDGPNTIQATIAHDIRISLPNLNLTHRNAVVIDLKILEPSVGHEVDGIIGSRLFDDFVVSIDYEARRLSIYAPSHFRPPEAVEALPVRIDQHGFQFIDVTISLPGVSPISASFLIDAGANMFADIYKPFADAHQLPPPPVKLLDEPGTGAGGTTQSQDGRADQMRIGSYFVKNPPITFAQETEGLIAAKDHAGLIGAEFLRRFTVIFDNPGKRLWLVPNRRYGEPAEYDQSGLRLQADGSGFHRFVVKRIVPQSPAAEAGIKVGDIIESIDGRPAQELTLTMVRDMFRTPSAQCTLELLRGKSQVRLTMRSRSLL